MDDAPAPIVCTLTTQDAASQRLEWVDLRARADAVEHVDGGVRFAVPAELEAGVRDLADREAACCAFLALTVETCGEEVAVTITSEQADALPIIHWMVGLRDEL